MLRLAADHQWPAHLHWRAGGSHIHFQSIGRGGTGTLFSRHIADLLSLRHANAVHDNHVSAAHISRSEEHTSELQSLMRISYAVFCLKKKNTKSITSN